MSNKMRPLFQAIDKTIVRWNIQLEKTTGIRLEPHTLITGTTAIVIFLQIISYLALSRQEIYCKLPSLRLHRLEQSDHLFKNLPRIYVITPTYPRHVQKAELTRLSHTLMLVPMVHWVIVEDSLSPSQVVTQMVDRLSDQFDFNSITQLHEPTPNEYKLKRGDPSWKYPKGVWQRNRALSWLRKNVNQVVPDGVVYFADDDNTYDLEVFSEMRHTERVSVWPVGLAGGLLVERPLVRRDRHDVERVIGFNSMWEPNRPFPIDMAGFAINIQLILNHPNSNFSENQRVGYIESHFLSHFVKSWNDLEPKAAGCRKVLVWHTKTRSPALHEETKLSSPSHQGMDL